MRLFLAGVVAGVAVAAAFIVGRVTTAQPASAASSASLAQVVAELKKANVTLKDLQAYDRDMLQSLDDVANSLAMNGWITDELKLICRNTAKTAGNVVSFCG